MLEKTTRQGILLMSALLAGPALAGDSPLLSAASADAPDGVRQYGQFEGSWSCLPEFRDAEGNWQQAPGRPTWVWHYVLDGHAVQDVWLPDPEHSPPTATKGTNLRVYDAENDEWDMVWTTETMGGFQHFTAKMLDGDIVMHGDIPAGQRPAHKARITFHNITDSSFDWKYEASGVDDGVNWQLFSTLRCERSGGAGTAP